MSVQDQYDDAFPSDWAPFPTAEERAFGDALARLDAELDADLDAELDAAADTLGKQADEPASDGDPLGDDAVVRALSGPADAWDLVLLTTIDPAALEDPRDRIAYFRALDRVARFVAALQLSATRAVAGATSSEEYLTEIHAEHELAVAGTTSQYAAGKAIETARTLAATFPAFEQALREGVISRAHCTVLVERTRSVVDVDALLTIGARALPKAQRLTPGQFGTEVEKLVARFDPDAAERHERAKRRDRRVWTRQLPDGMGFLGLVDQWPVVRAMKAQIDRDGRALQVELRAGATASTRSRRKAARKVDSATKHPHHPASLDSAAGEILDSADATRADALAARVLGTVSDDGSVCWDRESAASVVVEVVIDLATLRGEIDGFGLVDGQPVPAETARDWARGATLWRRMVTDPVTGHLIDHGSRVYAAEPLRRFVLARDGGCRNPVCSISSHQRLQMDHAEEFPLGATSAGNGGGLCTTSHQLKTAGFVDITDSAADGSCTWTTRWGQTVRIPPRAYLADADPPPGYRPSVALDDGPPF